MHRTVEEILNPVSGLPQILQKAIGLSLTTSALSRTFSNFFFCSWVYSSTLLRGRDGRPLARRTVPLLYRSLSSCVFTLFAQPVSVHRLGVAHQPSLQPLWTLMSFSTSLP